jgi:hypothetical protein
MPNYRFGKGPIAVTLENLLADRDRAMELLRQLYDENVSPNGLILAAELEARFGPIERNHFNNAFGENLPEGTPPAERVLLAEREGPQRVKVFREGVRKAALLVLGLDPEVTKDDLDNQKPRDTPFLIDVFWGCGQPYNEAWVSWHKGQNGYGYVCAVFYLTLLGTNLGREALVADRPNQDGERGLVVCHADPNGDWGWYTPVPAVGIPPQDRRVGSGSVSARPARGGWWRRMLGRGQ